MNGVGFDLALVFEAAYRLAWFLRTALRGENVCGGIVF